MKKLYLILLFSTLFLFTACNEKDPTKTLRVYNWGEYIADGVLGEFTDETGIEIIYETFASNEEMYSKIKSGGTYYDVIIPSDYMIHKMYREDMLSTINMAHIPNFRHIDPLFKNQAYDKNNEYSVAYMWGTVGILYNEKQMDAPDSWDILWDPAYKKEIFMYDSVRDSMGLALKRLGYSLNSTDEDEIAAAKNSLIEQFPLVQAYLGDGIKHKMIGEEGLLSVVYSGDAIYAMEENPDLNYILPKEGTNYWFDGIAIPKNAKNILGAELFIDFLCRPEIAARNSDYIGYSTANKAALDYLDPELVNNPIFWPDAEMLKNSEIFLDLGDRTNLYFAAWTEVLMQ